MNKMLYPNMEMLTWKKARDFFLKSEPELVKIIDALSPDDSYQFYKVRYYYGDMIYTHGVFSVPNSQGQLVPLNDSSIPPELQTALGYNPLPLGLSIGQGTEIYRELEDRIYSLAFVLEGLHMGIWEFFSPIIPTNVTAGARSLQLLPRISETMSHKKLKCYGVAGNPPKKVFDQWRVLKTAARHPDFGSPWYCDIIFFDANWVSKIKNDSAWLPFNYFLLKRAWEHAKNSRSKIYLETLWESFSRILIAKKVKPQPYIVETLQHLIYVGAGIVSGYRPATDNLAGPVDGFINMYLNDYELKYYYPSVIQPDIFNINSQETNNFSYYSMQVPSNLEAIPKTRTSVSTRADLAELIYLNHLFSTELIENPSLQQNAVELCDVFLKLKFDYFHDEAELHAGIRSSEDIGVEDPRFLYLPSNVNESEPRKFCARGSFVRGCVRMSRVQF